MVCILTIIFCDSKSAYVCCTLLVMYSCYNLCSMDSTASNYLMHTSGSTDGGHSWCHSWCNGISCRITWCHRISRRSAVGSPGAIGSAGGVLSDQLVRSDLPPSQIKVPSVHHRCNRSPLPPPQMYRSPLHPPHTTEVLFGHPR